MATFEELRTRHNKGRKEHVRHDRSTRTRCHSLLTTTPQHLPLCNMCSHDICTYNTAFSGKIDTALLSTKELQNVVGRIDPQLESIEEEPAIRDTMQHLLVADQGMDRAVDGDNSDFGQNSENTSSSSSSPS